MEFNEEFYQRVAKKFGYVSFQDRKSNQLLLPKEKGVLSARFVCAYRGDQFLSLRNSGANSIVTTGIGLSGPPHLGTVSQIMNAILLQKSGYRVQLVLGDIDAHASRNEEWEEIDRLLTSYRRFIVALGFDTNSGILRSQSESAPVLRAAIRISKYLSDKDLLDLEDLWPLYRRAKVLPKRFLVKLSIAFMLGDFLSLLIDEGCENVMITLGIDEHKYVLLTERIARRMNLTGNISGLFSRIIKDGAFPKMSKSIHGSAVSVDLPIDEIRRRMISNRELAGSNDSLIHQAIRLTYCNSGTRLDELRHAFNAGGEDLSQYEDRYFSWLAEICEKWNASRSTG